MGLTIDQSNKDAEAAGVWAPRLDRDYGGAQYRALVDALERDLAEGRVLPGARLPARRALASDLGLSMGTVTRAYEEMERRGLVDGQVGRGTFVSANPLQEQDSAARSGTGDLVADLSLNVAPDTGDAALLREMMRWLADSAGLEDRMGYLPHLGEAEPRAAIARGFAALRGCDFAPAETLLTHGAQHAVSLICELFASPVGRSGGAPILTESVSYTGMIALAKHRGYPLRGVAQDREGAEPEDLARVARETGAKLVYLTPTLQSPTAATMSLARRKAIVEVARAEDLYLIEDDCYGYLTPDGPPPLQTLAPERVFYLTSFAKCFAPALRLGMALAPPQFASDLAVGMRASSWMASPLLARGTAELVRKGELQRVAAAKREEATQRMAIARSVLTAAAASDATTSLHLWLPFADPQTALAFIGKAAARGVVLTAPDVVQVHTDGPSGVRICLGGPADHESLRLALRKLDEAYRESAWRSVV